MRTRRWILCAIVVAAFGGSYALKRSLAKRPEGGLPPERGASRVVSLAPSTTEVLFALGLGDRVVGVTSYCTFPPEALTKARVGGYYDPNYEAVVAARPDLVVTLPEHEEIRQELVKLGLKPLTVDHTTVRGILASFTTIGAACGIPDRAAGVRSELDARMKRIADRTAGRPRRRVLVTLGTMAGEESMTRITACGRGGFYDDLIGLAGGVNAFDGDIAYPALSVEGVLATKPDVIIDLWPDMKERGMDADAIRRRWKGLLGVTARVCVIGESHSVVPGPRIVLLLEEMERAIHD